MIALREIDRDNFYQIIRLEVEEHQKSFVAGNVYSLAQAKAMPECKCLAIYANDELVGFTMYCLDNEDREYWVYRIMIDKHYQS